jgi:hypothetical protein
LIDIKGRAHKRGRNATAIIARNEEETCREFALFRGVGVDEDEFSKLAVALKFAA